MPKHYVTFGQCHYHKIGGKVFNKDTVARFDAPNPSAGRFRAFELFGPKFCFEYHEDEFDFDSMRYYPLGFVDVPGVTLCEDEGCPQYGIPHVCVDKENENE